MRTAKSAAGVADAIDEAWHQCGSGGRHEVPMGVAATLSLLNPKDRTALVKRMQAMNARSYWGFSRSVWAKIVRVRTDLVYAIDPMIHWLFDEPDAHLCKRVKVAAEAALAAGLLDLNDSDRRRDVDLLGRVLAALRSGTESKVNARVYTPPDIADVLVSITMDAVKPGQAICEPTVGTGGLFRAAAKLLRQRSVDPASMIWVGADIDELAIRSDRCEQPAVGPGAAHRPLPRRLDCPSRLGGGGAQATAEDPRPGQPNAGRTPGDRPLLIAPIRVAKHRVPQVRCYLPRRDRPANRSRRPARRSWPDPSLLRHGRSRQLVRRHQDHRLDVAEPLRRDAPVPRTGRRRRPQSRMGARPPRGDRAMGARPPRSRCRRGPAPEESFPGSGDVALRISAPRADASSISWITGRRTDGGRHPAE